MEKCVGEREKTERKKKEWEREEKDHDDYTGKDLREKENILTRKERKRGQREREETKGEKKEMDTESYKAHKELAAIPGDVRARLTLRPM